MGLVLPSNLVLAQSNEELDGYDSGSSSDQVPEGEELVNIDFPEPTDIKDIIRAVALWTDKNVILGKGVNGKVQMISPKKVTKEEAYQAFLSALNVLNLTTVETGKVIKIMNVRNAIRGNLRTYQGSEWAPRTDNIITQIVPLKYIDSKQIRDRLTRLISGNAIIAYEPTNTLIISASGYEVRRILSIIDLLDVKGQQPQIVIVPIRHGDSKAIANQIKTLLDTSKRGSKSKNHGAYKILPDERSNSVVVFGPPRTIADVKAMIKKFDFPVDDPNNQASIRVRFLDYVDAKKLATTLSSLATTRSSSSASRRRTLGSRRTNSKANTPPPVADLGDNVKITADENSNALLITGSRAAYEALNILIRKLDRRRAQVYIETDILDISIEDSFKFGTSILAGVDGGPGTQASIGWQGDKGINSVIGAQIDGASTADKAAAASALAQNLTIGVLSGNKVAIPGLGEISPGGLITLIKTNANSRVLSSPHMLTTNNEEAKIVVGDTLFFQTAVESNVSAGGNIQKVEKENADLSLVLKPTVSNSGNYVTMKIDLEQKDGALNANQLPNIRKRQSASTVTVKNGQTAVVSGLMQTREEESLSKIPFLGDIPILGWLFRNSVTKELTTSLMIFITPHIVYGGNDLASIYNKKLEEQSELMKVAFGEDDSEANEWTPKNDSGNYVPDAYDIQEKKNQEKFLEELRKDMGYEPTDIEKLKNEEARQKLEEPTVVPNSSIGTGNDDYSTTSDSSDTKKTSSTNGSDGEDIPDPEGPFGDSSDSDSSGDLPDNSSSDSSSDE